MAAAHQRRADVPLEALVPEAVEPALCWIGIDQAERLGQLLADDEEPLVGAAGREAGAIELAGRRGELAHEVPVLDVLDAVQAEAVDMEVLHPAGERREHETPGGEECRLAYAVHRVV